MKFEIDISKDGNLWFMLNAIRGALNRIADSLDITPELENLKRQLDASEDKLKSAIENQKGK